MVYGSLNPSTIQIEELVAVSVTRLSEEVGVEFCDIGNRQAKTAAPGVEYPKKLA